MLSVNTVRAPRGRGTAFGARWQPAIKRQPTSSDRIVCDMNASARSRVREASVLVLTNKVELRGHDEEDGNRAEPSARGQLLVAPSAPTGVSERVVAPAPRTLEGEVTRRLGRRRP